jgi:hypothetical protein
MTRDRASSSSPAPSELLTACPQDPRAKSPDSVSEAGPEDAGHGAAASRLPPKSWVPRPARPYGPANLESLRHGAYSPRKVGERAEIVRQELLELVPQLGDPETASIVGLYSRAVAREELAHEAVEGGTVNARLLEAVSAAARVAKELGDALGVGPRAAAEIRQIRAETSATLVLLMREAPALIEVMRRTLEAIGHPELIEAFQIELARQIERIVADEP